jgi:hypothetical protein
VSPSSKVKRSRPRDRKHETAVHTLAAGQVLPQPLYHRHLIVRKTLSDIREVLYWY